MLTAKDVRESTIVEPFSPIRSYSSQADQYRSDSKGNEARVRDLISDTGANADAVRNRNAAFTNTEFYVQSTPHGAWAHRWIRTPGEEP